MLDPPHEQKNKEQMQSLVFTKIDELETLSSVVGYLQCLEVQEQTEILDTLKISLKTYLKKHPKTINKLKMCNLSIDRILPTDVLINVTSFLSDCQRIEMFEISRNFNTIVKKLLHSNNNNHNNNIMSCVELHYKNIANNIIESYCCSLDDNKFYCTLKFQDLRHCMQLFHSAVISTDKVFATHWNTIYDAIKTTEMFKPHIIHYIKHITFDFQCGKAVFIGFLLNLHRLCFQSQMIDCNDIKITHMELNLGGNTNHSNLWTKLAEF